MKPSTATTPENSAASPTAQPWSRRDFLGAAAATLFAGIAITLTGCDSKSTTAPATETGDVTGAISGNHGHSAVVTKAQINAGGSVTLDIMGSAGHTHTVTLSADEMVSIKAVAKVIKTTSTTNSHEHSITFN
jgi:hypothetical protein